jgi:hypothetical protein
MTIARSVAEVIRDHVVLEYEAIDRMYLNVYVPTLQTVGGMVGYLRDPTSNCTPKSLRRQSALLGHRLRQVSAAHCARSRTSLQRSGISM